jgi:hypothetical protein
MDPENAARFGSDAPTRQGRVQQFESKRPAAVWTTVASAPVLARGDYRVCQTGEVSAYQDISLSILASLCFQ